MGLQWIGGGEVREFWGDFCVGPNGIAARRWVQIAFILWAGLPTLVMGKAPTADGKLIRDARQLSMFVADLDGTLAHNLGNYRLRRISQIEAASPFFTSYSHLPEEILVPTHDFEGNVGPRISKRIGRLDERGLFIASTSLDPVTLSDGQVIIPGYYYLDRQHSFKEFRPPGPGEKGFLVSAVQEKIRSRTPFLLEGFSLFSAVTHEKYRAHVQGALLTMRGNSPQEAKQALQLLQTTLKVGKTDWPLEAMVNLGHPDFYEYSFSKVKYLTALYHHLTERVMVNKQQPHFLVMLENDRGHLREIDRLFQNLSNQGYFANPVVPILVNEVEPAVLQQPDGMNWDDAPMTEIRKMSRVTVYWPGGLERSSDLSRVVELTLGLSPTSARDFLPKQGNPRFFCAREIFGAKE